MGIITDEKFLYNYCPVPRIPMVGNATRMLVYLSNPGKTSAIISNTKILVIYFTKRRQTIRPSCTQAAVATNGEGLIFL